MEALAEALALLQVAIGKQAQGAALLEEGAELLKRVDTMLGPFIDANRPPCPTCQKPMHLKEAHHPAGGPNGRRLFWSCAGWEAHKKRGEKSGMDYLAWLRSLKTTLNQE